MSHDKNNVMVILSSPSGAGKTKITKKIQQKYQSFKISVSHTTRKPRPNEIDGVDYFFISHDEFQKFIAEDKFYEYFNLMYKAVKDKKSKSKTNKRKYNEEIEKLTYENKQLKMLLVKKNKNYGEC